MYVGGVRGRSELFGRLPKGYGMDDTLTRERKLTESVAELGARYVGEAGEYLRFVLRNPDDEARQEEIAQTLIQTLWAIEDPEIKEFIAKKRGVSIDWI